MVAAAYLAALAGCEPHWDAAAYGPELRWDDRIVILGQTNSGKTRHTLLMLERAQRVLVLDPAADPKWPAVGFEPWTVAELTALDGEPLARQRFRIVCHTAPEDWRRDDGKEREAEDTAREVRQFAALARDAEHLVEVFDEVGDYGACAGPTLKRVAKRDRHAGICALFLAQRAADIPLGVRAQSTDVISFVQSHPTDLHALEEWCGPDFAEAAKAWRRPAPPAHWQLSTRRKS